MPDEAVDLGQGDAVLGTVGVEQAQLHPLGNFAKHGEVGARTVIGRAQGVGPPGHTSPVGVGAAASTVVMAHLIPDK